MSKYILYTWFHNYDKFILTPKHILIDFEFIHVSEHLKYI